MNFFKITLITLLTLITNLMSAQINKPSLSPRVTADYNIGLAKATLDYGQPNKQDRVVFGGLIPYDRIWRTGANASTKLTFDKEVTIADVTIPAGTYGLYSIPNKDEWTIILHSNPKLWGSADYDEKNDFTRIKILPKKTEDTRETLAIYFENYTANGGDLIIAWENTKIVLPVFVDTDAIIFQEIEDKIMNTKEDISAQTYFDSAQFYYHKNFELTTAVKWFDKARQMEPNRFWYTYYRAELALELNDTKTAKKLGKECLEAAKNNPSTDYGYIAKATLLLNKLSN